MNRSDLFYFGRNLRQVPVFVTCSVDQRILSVCIPAFHILVIMPYVTPAFLTLTDATAVHSQPIYKGEVDMKTDDGNCPPGGQTAGFNGGSQTATA